MTTNQINYQKMLEDRRHNLAAEKETKRFNLVDAYLRNKQISSNYDIAQMQLDHSRDVLAETKRHNTSVEAKDLMYATRMLDETNRHNLAQEQVSIRNLDLMRQQINNNFAVGMANVRVAEGQLALSNRNLDEQIRHNIRSESELNRHNVALELNDRAKMQNDYELGLQRNAETQRNNVQQSLNAYDQLKEQKRHNRATEDVADRAQVTNTLTNLSEQANVWFKAFKH